MSRPDNPDAFPGATRQMYHQLHNPSDTNWMVVTMQRAGSVSKHLVAPGDYMVLHGGNRVIWEQLTLEWVIYDGGNETPPPGDGRGA